MHFFDWSNYLDFSKRVLNFNCDSQIEEAKYRTIVSRAYYAAFHNSSLYMKNVLGIPPITGPGAHQWVIDNLNNSSDLKANEAAAKLKTLKWSRRIADYDSDKKTKERHATNAIKLSEQIISGLK
jgi:uncharacterized protein (UPF0332 family)